MASSAKIIFTDETAIEFWNWRASTRSLLAEPKPARLPNIPTGSPHPPEALAASELFHRDESPISILVFEKGEFRKSDEVVYRSCGSHLPRGSAYRLSAGVYVCSPEFAFVRMAAKLNWLEVIKLGCEMTGRYMLSRDDVRGFAKREPITSCAGLAKYVQRATGMHGAKKAAAALKFMMDNAYSPREVDVALVLTLPKAKGGYGLPKPELNQPIEIDAETPIYSMRKTLKPDMLWSDRRVAIEYESTEFHKGEDVFIRDSKRRNNLIFAGYDVMTLTSDEFSSIDKMDKFAESIRRKLKIRKTQNPPDYITRQLELRDALRKIRGTQDELQPNRGSVHEIDGFL